MADLGKRPGGPNPLRPSLFWVKKKKKRIAEGRKAGGASDKKPGPPLAQSLDPPLLMYGNMLIFLIVFVKINHLLRFSATYKNAQ